MFKIIALTFFLVGCSSAPSVKEVAPKPTPGKDFASGEIILSSQLLTKIFDKEMAPIQCVPDTDEASLLLRTLRPRMEVVQDDIEAMLDDSKEVDELIRYCEQNCTCDFVDELFREHQVTLSKTQKAKMSKARAPKEVNRCMSYIQSTFCQSELYKTLEVEKSDFSFEE